MTLHRKKLLSALRGPSRIPSLTRIDATNSNTVKRTQYTANTQASRLYIVNSEARLHTSHTLYCLSHTWPLSTIQFGPGKDEMKDYSGKEVEISNIGGQERQRDLAIKLCHDCRGILERTQDLENGARKNPIRKRSRKLRGRLASLEIGNLDPGQKFEDLPISQELPEDNSLPHKSNRADLLASSELGCIMCTWLLRSLESQSTETCSTLKERWLKRPATVERDRTRGVLCTRCLGHYRVYVRSPIPEPPHPSVVRFTKEEQRELVSPCVEIPVPFEQPRDDELGSLVVDVISSSNESRQLLSAMANLEPTTPSSSTWELFRTRLQACDNGHAECKRPTTRNLAQLPGLLIDVQSVDTIKVIETSTLLSEEQSALPKYATLSHCWGETHEPQLNTRTSDRLRKGIAIKDLPKLFHDTVILVKKLGIPYLWIDSLCIQQDSADDRHREASKMGSVYYNANLYVAASAGKNNSSSILEQHPKDWPQPLMYDNLVIQAEFLMATSIVKHQSYWCNGMRTFSE